MEPNRRVRPDWDGLVAAARDVRRLYDETNRRTLGRTWDLADFTLGFVGDVGDLAKLVMAYQGHRADVPADRERIAHELSDCLFSLLVIAEETGIDLGAGFADDMTALAARIGGGGAADSPAPELREFAEAAVGRIAAWTDASWARAGSRVWRVHGRDGGEWFVKVHRESPRFHDREVAAYRTWVPLLGGAAPRLVAVAPALRAVVVTAVPGRSLHGAMHGREEQQRVFRRIGELAAAIHGAAPARPGDGSPRVLERLERHLEGARGHLAPGDEDLARAATARAAELPPLDAVPTHGDLQFRNLLWEPSGDLYVIDFERAEPGPAVRDFVRLADSWADRPDLAEALFDGYGRDLTDTEQEYLAVHCVLDAVSGIQYGAANHDPELVERGLRTLARLRATHRP
ncbi:phosphotransferase [Kitasatospora sp. NPDC002965]|uniref:phosphotransferase n=1 Tax=Kitasatospora sp. NPDC002965 TaxID=3154775 RepID=UPI0033A62ABB